MAYTRAWDETQPLGSAAANTIDDIIRALKVDLRERLNELVISFAADPVVPKIIPAVSVYHTVDRTHGTAVMPWNAERFDTDAFHDIAVNNSRLTVPAGKAGLYAIHLHLTGSMSSTENYSVRIMKNGSDVRFMRVFAISNLIFGADLVAVEVLAAGDYIESMFFRDTGSGVATAVGGITNNSFEMLRIGGA